MRPQLRSAFNARQYMLNEDFEIYYYNDLHFHAVESHTHNYYEFYLFLEGSVTLRIGNQSHTLQPGDVILVPPGIPHHVMVSDSEVPYRRFIFWISSDFTNALLKESVDYVYLIQQATSQQRYLYHLNSLEFNRIQNLFLDLLEEIHANHYGKRAAINLDVSRLLLTLNRTIYEKEHPTTAEENPDLLQHLFAYIESHIDEPLSLETLAEVFYVSRFHIAHLFKEQMGISVHQYILKKRLDACRKAMLSGAQPGKVSLEYGFQDYSTFFRAFKKEYGLSPMEYQSVYLNDPLRVTSH